MKKVVSVLMIILCLTSACVQGPKEQQAELVTTHASTAYSYLSREYVENANYQIEGALIPIFEGGFQTDLGDYDIVAYDTGDVNNDQIADLFILLRNDSRGSGTFYYTNLLLGGEDGVMTVLEEQFIGDRIDYSHLQIHGFGEEHPVSGGAILLEQVGVFSLGYYTHADDQPLSEEPQLWVTAQWRLADGQVQRIDETE